MPLPLTVVTWNIHRCIGMDRRFDPARVVEVLRHHDADVVLLQEVDRGVPRSRRLWLDHELARALDYPFHAWAQAHTLKEGSYGNAVLSRFPIVKRRHLELTIGWRKRRNALYVRLQLPRRKRPLHVFDWHLGLSARERRRQVEKLLHSGTHRSIRPRDPVILGGDTNDWRNLLYRGAGLEEAGYHAWSESGRRQPLRTFPAPSPAGALDKVFWRGPLREIRFHVSRLALARVASDHRPLVAEFVLERS